MSAPAPPAANRILIVDDNITIHDDFRKILTASADSDEASLQAAEAVVFNQAAKPAPAASPVYELDFATQGQEGFQMVERAADESRPYALAFVDVRMPPGWDGIETVEHIWKKYPELPVVICTAYSDYSWHEMMARFGPADNLVVLRKPFEAVEVQQLAHSLTRKWLLARQVRAHVEELDHLVATRTRSLQAANEELQRSEERFAKAFRHSPVPLVLANATDWRFVDANENFLQLTAFQREKLIGRQPGDLNFFSDSALEREIRDSISAKRPIRNRQVEFHAPDGRIFTALVSAEPLNLQNQPHALLSLQDITERIHIENQLQQAQKMEAVGQIAAGVAHDFNNLLAVIQGHAELQMSDGHQDQSLRESLQAISQAANRAASLTRQLLAFSRKQMLQPQALDLAGVLNNLGNMLRPIVGEEIQLQIHCAENLPPVLVDPTNLEQVVINLAVNARDAMPHGGPLTIAASLALVDEQHKARQPDAVLGTFIKLSVADKGLGMDAAVRRKIFEPFFTTKAIGKGTGMGLAAVYGIVKQHQGWIEVESQPGAGSEFAVFLPLAQNQPAVTTQSGTEFVNAKPMQPRKILVVEDETPVREMAAKIFKRLGHEVITAENGPEALKLWPQHRGKIDLLFTDMRMPGGMSGRELAESLLRDSPAMRVIYCTGYSVDFSNPEINLVEGVNLLLKPFNATALTHVLKKALANGRW